MFGGSILTANDEYIKTRMEQAGKKMGENTHNGQLYEYHKGQFLAFREILEPETYGDKKYDLPKTRETDNVYGG